MAERRTVEVSGSKLYAPDSAPVDDWVCAHWSDGIIAISFQENNGQWWRGRAGRPVVEKATVSLVGWVPISLWL